MSKGGGAKRTTGKYDGEFDFHGTNYSAKLSVSTFNFDQRRGTRF